MTLKRALKLMLLMAMSGTVVWILAAGAERLLAQNPSQGNAQQPGSINNEDCAVCHEDVVTVFNKQNPHAVLEQSPKYNLKNSCESCHGPGEAHASAGGEKALIVTFKEDDNKTYNRQCLSCHGKHQELTGFKSGSRHERSGLACSDCHSVHAGTAMTRLLKEPSNALCMGCHVEQKADFSRPFHHRVPENALSCTDCHQPHGGLDGRQVRLTHAGEDACVRCHTEKAGPFVFQHAPMHIRDCMSCHEPHGSNYSKMLVRSNVRALCLECHSTSANVLTSQPPSFHNTRSPRYQNCTTCHVKIHGSNSSALFLR